MAADAVGKQTLCLRITRLNRSSGRARKLALPLLFRTVWPPPIPDERAREQGNAADFARRLEPVLSQRLSTIGTFQERTPVDASSSTALANSPLGKAKGSSRPH